MTIPRPRPAHLVDVSLIQRITDAELDTLLEGRALTRHGRRCACCATSPAVTR